MTSRMFAALFNHITEVFDLTCTPYFLGGSFRFGYQNNSSDMDLFILCNNPDIFIKELFSEDVDSIAINSSYSSETGGVHHKGFNGLVDFIFIKDEKSFCALKNEHEEISKFLVKNSYLRDFISNLPASNLKGKDIYRTLKKLHNQN